MRRAPAAAALEIPTRVEEVWRVEYEERATEAQKWGRQYGVGPASARPRRVALLLVDLQNTFCTPGFELFVPGAPDDNRRLCEFVYRNLGAITQIIPTLDTHKAMQVFHAAWLVNAEGRHPSPYTVVSAEDVENAVVAGRRTPRSRAPSCRTSARSRPRRPLPADDLALPRDARRDRPRARLVGRGGGLLPRHRPVVAARLPGQGRRPAHRALLGARARRSATGGTSARRAPRRDFDAVVDRRPGEEPLRRLDARRPARRRPRRARLPARGLHLSGRRPRARSTSPSEANTAFAGFAARGVNVVRSTDRSTWPDGPAQAARAKAGL